MSRDHTGEIPIIILGRDEQNYAEWMIR